MWRCGTRRRSWNSTWPKGTVGRKLALLKPPSPVAPGTHPCALEFSPDGKTLYVALANRDAVAAVNVSAGQFSVKGYFDTRLPGQSYFGAEPEALAVNADGSRLYVANVASDAVAVIDTGQADREGCEAGAWWSRLASCPRSGCRCPWRLFLQHPAENCMLPPQKGKGTGPNNFPQRQAEERRQAQVVTAAPPTLARCYMARWPCWMRPRSRRICRIGRRWCWSRTA